MSKTSKKILGSLILTGITAAFALFIDIMPDNISLKIMVLLLMYIIAIIIICLFDAIWQGWLKSRFDLWHIGKVRGLWRDEGLKKQIKENFYSSSVIKIKVTRGIELLDPENDFGLNKILCDLRDGKCNHNSNVMLKILLIIPCMKDKHVLERAKRHNGMSLKDFVETWYEFLKKIQNFNSEHLSINVKFYFGNHSRWRFYIFSGTNSVNSIVLLSDYDVKSRGCEEPMYKVIKSENNLGMFMNDYFNDLWNESLSPHELYQHIDSQNCIAYSCKKCMKAQSTNCQNCNKVVCEYKDVCKKFLKDYKRYMENN